MRGALRTVEPRRPPSGSGPFGLHGSAIPVASRIALASLTLDSLYQSRGWSAAVEAAGDRSGSMLDPAVAEACRLKA